MLIAIFSLIVLLFSIVIHEVAHGNVALALGDPTAKYAGRLTLNPIKHLDPFGSILLPIFLILTTGRGFGWTKPVPINPYNFRDKKWGILKVSIAGPVMNFLIGIIFALICRFAFLPSKFLVFLKIISFYNFAWGIFNLIPLPFPPSDGYHILFSLLPQKLSHFQITLNQYGVLILVVFLFFGLSFIFRGATFLFSLISGQPLII